VALANRHSLLSPHRGSPTVPHREVVSARRKKTRHVANPPAPPTGLVPTASAAETPPYDAVFDYNIGLWTNNLRELSCDDVFQKCLIGRLEDRFLPA
jgi:hypothetical protein